MFGIHRNFPAGGGGGTGDATAEQWHIQNGLTAYIASGKVTGNGYFPPLMQFNGSTGYYSGSLTTSGNKVSAILRFKVASFTGGSAFMRPMIVRGPNTWQRVSFIIFSSDYSTAAYRSKLYVATNNSSNTTICQLISSSTITDNELHTAFYDFDADTGTAVFRIDGTDEDDTGNAQRVAPTTGTLDSGASSTLAIGANTDGSGKTTGRIGFVGYHDAAGLDWSDFMQTDGFPKPLDESTWAEWTSQPRIWHEAAKMDEHLGSASAMTKNGTITLASAIP